MHVLLNKFFQKKFTFITYFILFFTLSLLSFNSFSLEYDPDIEKDRLRDERERADREFDYRQQQDTDKARREAERERLQQRKEAERERKEAERERKEEWKEAKKGKQEAWEKAKKEWKEAQKERKQDWEDAKREQKEADREGREEWKEAKREQKEATKDLEDKCDKAHEDVEQAMKDAKEEREKWEEQFYDLEENITDLEKANTESQVEISEKTNDLKKESNQTVQDFKDDMGEAIKEIDEGIQNMEETISQLHQELDKVEDDRLAVFYAYRNKQNEFYSTCFGQALEQTEKERSRFFQKSASKTLKRKSVGTLISGGKQQVKDQFSNKFNSYLHLCLNNQAALLKKQNLQNENALTLERLKRKEERVKVKIEEITAQIKNMQTTSKVDIMKRFKEKMEAELNNFSQAYDSLTANHNKNSKQTLEQIDKVKEQQSYVLMNRSKVVPQKERNRLFSQKCDGMVKTSKMNAFNLFPPPRTPPPPRPQMLPPPPPPPQQQAFPSQQQPMYLPIAPSGILGSSQ